MRAMVTGHLWVVLAFARRLCYALRWRLAFMRKGPMHDFAYISRLCVQAFAAEYANSISVRWK